MDALIRDDTAANRVYIKPMNLENGNYFNLTDTNEFVYMDYNLEVGDSLIMPLVFAWDEDSISIHKVLGIDSVLIENSWYKKFLMQWSSTSVWDNHTYERIEGIGPLPVPVAESMPGITCFSNQGVIPSIFYQDCFFVSVKDLDKPDVLFNIYPIPAKDQLTISLNKVTAKHYQVQIINLLGQVLVEERFQKQVLLNLNRYSPGIYLLRIFEEGQLLQSDKLCISK